MDLAHRARPPGSRIGDYELGASIGGGPFGHVYTARHRSGRACVIKLFDTSLCSPAALRRCLEVSNAAATLQGAGAPEIFEAALEGAQPFFAEEHVPGESLRAFLRDHPRLTWGDARSLFAAIAARLAVAHEAGVVHGDLKPENILLRRAPDGSFLIRLVDWGMGSRGIERDENTRADLGLSINYHAPEQLRGDLPSPATDLYALGVILYEALVGECPFKGPPNLVAMHHMRTPPPSPRALLPRLPQEADDLVAALLEKDPHRRLSSAARLHERLADDVESATQVFVREPRPTASPPPPQPQSTSTSTGTVLVDRAALQRGRQDETVILDTTAPPAAEAPATGEITLIVQGTDGDMLMDTSRGARLPPKEETGVNNDPNATVIVHRVPPPTTAPPSATPPPRPTDVVVKWLRRPWTFQRKIIALNVAFIVVTLISIARILSRS